MRKILMIVVLLGFFSVALAAWESIGPYGGYLRPLAVAPSDQNIIYVASYSNPAQIYRSDDGGATWDHAGSISYYAYSLAVDPTNPDIVYVGAYTEIYKSTNGGATWTSYSLPGYYAYGLVVDPNSPSTLYATGRVYIGSVYYLGFFKSTNGGVSWSSLQLSNYNGLGYCLILDPSNFNTIYVGGYYYISSFNPCVYKSIDGGSSFTECSSGFPSQAYYIYSLAVHPTNSNMIYAGSYYRGIYRSTDAGGSWDRVSPPNYQYLYTLTTTQAAPDLVYAGSSDEMYKSIDQGNTWSTTSTGLNGSYFRGLAASQTSATVVYTACNKGFFKTTDAGANWFDSNYGMNMGSIDGFNSPFSSPSTIYTSYEEMAVFKSVNNGSDWTMLPTPVGCGNICAFAFENTNPNIVYALEGRG